MKTSIVGFGEEILKKRGGEKIECVPKDIEALLIFFGRGVL